MTSRRKKAIIRRRIFIAFIVAIFLMVAAIVTLLCSVIIKNNKENEGGTSQATSAQAGESSQPYESAPDGTSVDNTSSGSDSQPDNKQPEIIVTPTGVELDANYGRLLLVNGENPLPEDYEYGNNLTTIDQKYLGGSLDQIDVEVWPYMKAMLDAARAEGVNLNVWSPYRSYATQNMLFQKQVERVGGDEVKAATVVARPGTSEHNTGLCADFNMASDAFEDTPMYEWMCENAENYGFILRYPESKQPITGVIYESWHWRFVGINNAKEINDLGVTLEEYIELKGLDPTMDMYGDDDYN